MWSWCTFDLVKILVLDGVLDNAPSSYLHPDISPSIYILSLARLKPTFMASTTSSTVAVFCRIGTAGRDSFVVPFVAPLDPSVLGAILLGWKLVGSVWARPRPGAMVCFVCVVVCTLVR